MIGYRTYMDRQQVSPGLHQRLLELNTGKKTGKRTARARWGALAAGCALVLGLGVWQMGQRVPPVSPDVSTPAQSGAAVSPDGTGLLPAPPDIAYPSVKGAGGVAASIALMEGSFTRELTGEDIRALFGGEVPARLGWEGYALTASAIYDGSGKLYWLTLYGIHPEGPEFCLELSPGRLPPACLVEAGRGTTLVDGVEVTGWSRAYDRNGDNVTDYSSGSEFMAGELGVRFENTGSRMRAQNYGGFDNPEQGGSAWFNALFVAFALEGGLQPDHLLSTQDVPQWREADFDTLEQARQEEAFARYLPEQGAEGYGEFEGRLTYQEGNEHVLWVRWSRGYDDVRVYVSLPEGDHHYETVDAANPASYDTRLYTIPWSRSVPEEYRSGFYMTNFRAQDMSPELVKARVTTKDTGGESYRFGVLHPDGTLVEYDCSGLTAEQVWALVEPTLG